MSLVEKSNVAGDLFDAIYKKTGLSHEDGDYSLTFGTEEGASSLMACDGFDAYLMEGQDLTLKIQAVSRVCGIEGHILDYHNLLFVG